MAKHIATTPLAMLTAVSSRRMTTAREFADLHGIALAFDDWQDLCAADGVDAIYVATPTSVREEIKPIPLPNVQVPTLNPDPVGTRVVASDFTTAPLPASTTREASISSTPSFTPYTVEPTLRNRSAVERALRDNYTRVLREGEVGGTVRLWVLIDSAGRVIRTELQQTSGNDILDRAASKVANVMQFTPAMNRDRRVSVWIQLPIHFKTQ